MDGATSVYGRNSSVGAIIRDSEGAIKVACSKYFQGQFSVEEVEALVVEAGILLARDLKRTQIIVESDAASTVSEINERLVEGNLGHLYQGIIDLLSAFTSWKIKHVKREYNRAAHELATRARMKKDSQVWVGDFPTDMLGMIQDECSW
ncbi:uncharacterized protein LOC142632547 [Castanea sativa]|uniref:uncharacterized protein LOC142632547 n=1 Tax=Castanea sativa TaxID=21020 RepID=UPI003F64E6E9